MAYSGTTTHYGLPKYVSTDKPSWLDTNDGFDAIDQALYAAAQAVDPAQIAQMQNDITALQTGKQNVLTFDATPTNGSVNPVTSGGVYTAVDGVATSVSTLNTVLRANKINSDTPETDLQSHAANSSTVTFTEGFYRINLIPSSSATCDLILRQDNSNKWCFAADNGANTSFLIYLKGAYTVTSSDATKISHAYLY